MDWILDHLQIVIAIGAAIAYWLNARRNERAGRPADYDGDGRSDNAPGGGGAMRDHERSMEHAENTRRIQEEIRRKIAERQGGGHQPGPILQPAGHATSMPAAQVRRREVELARQAAEARREEAQREATVVLERQRELASQLAVLQSRKDEAGRQAKAVWTQETRAATRTESPDGGDLLRELRSARSLRKAIILREVLGTPLGLR
jgi:hypothetical protein